MDTCGLSRVLLGVGEISHIREMILTQFLLDYLYDCNKNYVGILIIIDNNFSEVKDCETAEYIYGIIFYSFYASILWEHQQCRCTG